MEDDEQDIYDVAPPIDKTVSDIKKLKSMFEQKPMAVHTPGNAALNAKFATDGPQSNKPTPALKPKPGAGKLMPTGFQNELQNRTKQYAPNLPNKAKRISIDEHGDIKKSSSNGPPSIPNKGVNKINKPAPPIKEKPKFSPKDKNDNSVITQKASNETSKVVQFQNNVNSSKGQNLESSAKDERYDNNVNFEGETLHCPNGDKYRKVKFAPSSGPAPAKKPLPLKINIDDILQQYAEDDDMYDDVIADDPNNRVSVIPEFTEEEEKELADKAKQAQKSNSKQEEFEQEEYDDVRVSNEDRKNKSLSLMSTGSDIYETFDEIQEGGDVQL